MHEKLTKIIKQIDSSFPEGVDKTEFLLFFLGISVDFSQYIIENVDFDSLPIKIKYYILLTMANQLTIVSDNPHLQKFDIEKETLIEITDTEDQVIINKLKIVIKQITKSLKEIGEEL